MTNAFASDQPDAADWPAPQPGKPSRQLVPEQRRSGTAAIVLGVVGSIVGAITFAIVWLGANMTLNSCRYAGPDGNVDVDVGQARLWLSLATLFWMALPIRAGPLTRRTSRDAPVWFVIAGTFAAIGIWAIARLGPWELCM
jgi:hypothetical protein